MKRFKINVKFLPSCGSVALGLQEFPKNKPKISRGLLKRDIEPKLRLLIYIQKTLFALPAGLLRQKIHCFLW